MRHLGVFAKYWEPGTVKTRLARDIGTAQAARLYREFVAQTLSRFANQADQRSLWIWPPERDSDFLELAGADWTIQPQSSGDLGQRMRHFFSTTLNDHQQVILVGSDTPDLPHAILTEAWSLLDAVDVVVGPAVDNGYYLIGMRTDATEIFHEISWSTPQVLPGTIERLQQSGLTWQLLDRWRDVDTLQDLRYLKAQLDRQSEDCQQAMRALIHEVLKFADSKNPPATSD